MFKTKVAGIEAPIDSPYKVELTFCYAFGETVIFLGKNHEKGCQIFGC